MEIIQKPKLTKEDNKTFSKAVKIAANKELISQVQVTDEKGYVYWKTIKKTAVERLADQIIEMALDPDTPLKDKVLVFEKMAKVSEGETKHENKTITLGTTSSYEEFLLKAESQRQLLGNKDESI